MSSLAASAAPAWRNRITGSGTEAPDQLLAHPSNWRTHGKAQREALAAMLAALAPAEPKDGLTDPDDVSEPPDEAITKDFQRQFLQIARLYRWHAYHPALSKWSERGWPDIALCRPPRLVFAELKSEKGKTTEHQERWLRLLRACPGVEVFLWRPSDLEHVAEVLR